jgi:hypothetical protein
MRFKYAEKIKDLDNCPPRAAAPGVSLAFRFVHNPIRCPDHFRPVAVVQPNRVLRHHECCEAWSLSFFVSREAALAKFKSLQKSNKQIHKRLGDHLASGNLTATDGHLTAPNGHGHFSLFEDESSNFSGRFQIIERLA